MGLPPHLGGVAHALGPQWWTNNSTDLFDMTDDSFIVTSHIKQKGNEQKEANGTRSKEGLYNRVQNAFSK